MATTPFAPARALNKDRFFTYITSIAEENAFFNSGSSAGFGVRLSYDAASQSVVIAEAYETAPAFAAGIDRGARIIMCSALGQQHLIVDAIKAGVKDFIVKPFKPDRMLAAIEKALRQ